MSQTTEVRGILVEGQNTLIYPYTYSLVEYRRAKEGEETHITLRSTVRLDLRRIIDVGEI